MSIEFKDLSQYERELYHNRNKPSQDELTKIDHIAKEIARKEDMLFERRVLKILERYGLIVLPLGKEATNDTP